MKLLVSIMFSGGWKICQLFCVQLKFALAPRGEGKTGCRNWRILSFSFFKSFLRNLDGILMSYPGSSLSLFKPYKLIFTCDFCLCVNAHLKIVKMLGVSS